MNCLLLTCAIGALQLAATAIAEKTPPTTEEKANFAGAAFGTCKRRSIRSRGVIATRVGYTGGFEANPSYEQVSFGQKNHREAIEVTFDPTKASYAILLDSFWRNINPVQTDGQFHDVGRQYTSAIFYKGDEQKKTAETSKDALGKSGKFKESIAIIIFPAGQFWPAEEYHQKYYSKNPTADGMYHLASGRESYQKRIWGGN